MNEIWKNITVEGFENYQVSNCGNVRSSLIRTKWGGWTTRKNPILLHQERTKEGYYRVALYNNKCGKKFAVHRLVAMAFIPNPENKPCVDHINTIRTDDKKDNLRWVTYSENMKNPLTMDKISKKSRSWGWWNNGIQERRVKGQMPSPWVRGRLETTKNKVSKSLIGKKISQETKDKMSVSHQEWVKKRGQGHFWTNGVKCVWSIDCPGRGYKKGSLSQRKGYHWWQNGETETRSVQSPGPDWKLGRCEKSIEHISQGHKK